MSGGHKLMKMPSCLKKKLKDGMIKEFKNGNSKWVSMFYCTILILDFLHVSFSPNGKDVISPKRFIAPVLSRSIMPKAQIREWSMGKELNIIF